MVLFFFLLLLFYFLFSFVFFCFSFYLSLLVFFSFRPLQGTCRIYLAADLLVYVGNRMRARPRELVNIIREYFEDYMRKIMDNKLIAPKGGEDKGKGGRGKVCIA